MRLNDSFYGTAWGGGSSGVGVAFKFRAPSLGKPGDFDGDGESGITVFRPSAEIWYSLNSATNYTSNRSFALGLKGDIAVAADYDGDGYVDPAVFRPADSTWHVFTVGDELYAARSPASRMCGGDM